MSCSVFGRDVEVIVRWLWRCGLIRREFDRLRSFLGRRHLIGARKMIDLKMFDEITRGRYLGQWCNAFGRVSEM